MRRALPVLGRSRAQAAQRPDWRSLPLRAAEPAVPAPAAGVPGLLPQIDHMLAHALQAARPAAGAGQAAVTALVGLRRNLFPQAPALAPLPTAGAPRP